MSDGRNPTLGDTVEPKPCAPEADGELRDEDIVNISGGGEAKNANNGELVA